MSKKNLVRLLVDLYGDAKHEKKFQKDRKKFVAKKNLTKAERGYLVDGDVKGLKKYLGSQVDALNIVDEKLSHIVDEALSHIVDSALARKKGPAKKRAVTRKKARKPAAKKPAKKKAGAKKTAKKAPAKRRKPAAKRPKPKK